MPSIGRIKQVSVVGIAAAVLGVTASSASAADVWVWACHGPSGQALPNLGSRSTPNPQAGCSADGGGVADGLQVRQTGAGGASRTFGVPFDTTLQEVRISRQTSLVAGQQYVLRSIDSPATEFERRDGSQEPLSGEASFPASLGSTGGTLEAAVSCMAGGCTPPESGSGVDIGAVAMRLTDAVDPTGVVGGWRSPAAGTINLDVQASDVGIGLRDARAFLDGQPHGPAVRFTAKEAADQTCDELSPESPQIDLPYGAVSQNDSAGGPVGCVKRGSVTLPVDTTTVGDGKEHVITVMVSDWSGREVEIASLPTEVLNRVNLGSPTQTLNIGTSGITQQPNTGGSGGSGGVAGATSTACRSPRLSMFLAQKPMRVSRRVPVLQRGKRYRFNGRLTCVINGKRRSAPKRTRVDILNTIGRKTFEKAGTTTRDQGRLTVILAYKTSRLLTFRFTNSDGQRSQVRIRVKVARKR
jgi:hypothetical protein